MTAANNKARLACYDMHTPHRKEALANVHGHAQASQCEVDGPLLPAATCRADLSASHSGPCACSFEISKRSLRFVSCVSTAKLWESSGACALPWRAFSLGACGREIGSHFIPIVKCLTLRTSDLLAFTAKLLNSVNGCYGPEDRAASGNWTADDYKTGHNVCSIRAMLC